MVVPEIILELLRYTGVLWWHGVVKINGTTFDLDKTPVHVIAVDGYNHGGIGMYIIFADYTLNAFCVFRAYLADVEAIEDF
jgi:hypothetical protein